MTNEQFLAAAEEVHPGKYTYPNLSFVKKSDIITIVCPTHGPFQQRISVHLIDRCGCPNLEHRSHPHKATKETFIEKSVAIHGDRYDYSEVIYLRALTKVKIFCKIHQEHFEMTPNAHLSQKQKCPKCGLLERNHPQQKSPDRFIEQAIEKWGNIYDYKNTIYTKKIEKIKYFCNKCEIEVEQSPVQHLKNGCPFCSGRGIGKHTPETWIAKSKDAYFSDQIRAKQEIADFISSHGFTIIRNDREAIYPKEINIWIPDHRLGIEYHGNYFHTEQRVGKNHYSDMADLADKNNLFLIQIFENEWEDKKEIVKSRLLSHLGINAKIYARKTRVVELSSHEKNEFLHRTHIQSKDASLIHLGLTSGTQLVACMTFGKPRFNKKYDYELIRYSSELMINVIGGPSKLLAHFRKNNPGSVLSYADRRWSTGNLYKMLGFVKDKTTKPGYRYYHSRKKGLFNWLQFQKHLLVGMPGYDLKLTEYEIMRLNGYDRLWDAGHTRWVLEK